MSQPDDAHERVLRQIQGQQLQRHLSPFQAEKDHVVVRNDEGRAFVSFSSNDYLGLAHHPKICQAAIDSIASVGLSSGASRLISGTTPDHKHLEEALAEFKETEAALTFANGYASAAGFASAFLSKSSIVIADKLTHASLIDATRLAKATLRVYRHNDLDKLEHLLAWARRQTEVDRVVVVTESIFSMDGDASPLKDIVLLKQRYGAELLLDEAHATGVLGPHGKGMAAEYGLTEQIDYHLGTLGKALGTAGGYIAGSAPMIEVLLNKARSFIYSTAPPAALARASCAALEVVQSTEGEERRTRLRARTTAIAAKLEVPPPPAAILPFVTGSSESALCWAKHLKNAGFYVPAIRYPTVPRRQARLRLTVSADHTEAQIVSLTQAIRDYGARHARD